jgi:hypothetical protein
MRQEPSGPVLTAVFVDYDNIYLSLKRKSEEAAKRFSKDAQSWLKEIETGRLITPTNGPITGSRRIVMNRCYGNPVPRRNTHDNSTDMTSFPFVRHHFLRAGFEVIDCPPLTAQLKNSSDIRMVMDVRDFLNHDTYFQEFVIMSGDADFTPVLHRLRAHARRTVIFANDYTAAPYTAICDGEVRESHLLSLLLEGRLPAHGEAPAAITASANLALGLREEIIGLVTAAVRASNAAVPLEVLAERTTRALGHERTVGTGWAGAGSFLDLLRQNLPDEVKLTDHAPYLAYNARLGLPLSPPASIAREERLDIASRPAGAASAQQASLDAGRGQRPAMSADTATQLQQSIARIHDACQAPPFSPPEYRVLFEVMAKEINDGGLQGVQTHTNIETRARELGIAIRREDVRFILEVVSEADPWFEQGASANLFAGRFRNFVVARCRSQGLTLSSDELDLIEAWFAGNGTPLMPPVAKAAAPAPQAPRLPTIDPVPAPARAPAPSLPVTNDFDDALGDLVDGEEFPKILRTRARG